MRTETGPGMYIGSMYVMDTYYRDKGVEQHKVVDKYSIRLEYGGTLTIR